MSFRSLASLRVAASFAVILIVSACSDDRVAQLSAVETIEVPPADAGQQQNQNIANPTLEIPVTYPVGEGDELTLVWSEEFDGPDIDPEVWFFATGDGSEKNLPSGWGNNELQWYLPDNAMIVNGVLEITARRETVGNFNYTSARINTEDRFAFKYGRIEASIKMPSGQGLLPAFWMLSQSEDLSKNSDYECGGQECIWAAIGEIDIVEASNPGATGGNEILGTIHYGGEFPGNVSTTTSFTPSENITETFNTYALEWDEDEIRWYFNGELYASQPEEVWFSTADNGGEGAPFNQPFHILLNVAVGHEQLTGPPDGTTPWPVTMAVDWVRVYSGEPPPAQAGDVPENAVFVTDPNVTADLAATALDNFGSGATFDQFYAGDSDFKPTLQVTSGNAYEDNPDVGFVAFTLYEAGFAADYETLSFKVKGLPGDELEIKFFGSPENSIIINLAAPAAGITVEDLGNGWYQVTVPMSEFVANVYAFTGFLIGPPGDQGAPFSFLLTDIGFNGNIVTTPALAGTTPDVTLYARGAATDLVFGEDYTEVSVFGSGAIADDDNNGDVDFSPAFAVSTGFGYDKWNAQLAFLGFDAGFASSYLTLDFKVKGMAGDVIRVKLLNDPNPEYVNVDLTDSGYATPLDNGWYQVVVPIADIPGDVATASGLLFETIEPAPDASFTFLLNDIGFSGTAAGGPVPPAAPASAPTQAAGDVISIYSDSYTDNPRVGLALYGLAAFEEVDIAGSGNSALKYTRTDVVNGNFQVLELGGDNQIDASGMTNFRFDLYFPNPIVAAEQFLLKLVNINGGVSEELVFINSSSTPAIAQGTWLSFDLPLASLTNLTGTSNIQQVVFDLLSENDVGEVYVDNIYFYNAVSGPIPPAAPASAPTQAAGDVISIYSDSYTDNPRVGLALYGAAAFEEVDIAGSGNSALKYTRTDVVNGNFQVLELGGDNQIDASGMTNFRFDLYFPNPIVAAEQFLLKLVNINGGVSEELVFINSSSTPAIAQGTWLSFDLPLASLTNLTGTSNIQQVVFDLLSENDVGEVYVDNIYFYNAVSGPIPPAAPASAPTQAAGDVISIYSDSYTDNPRVGLALYGAAAFEEVDIAGSGNSALKYTRTDVVNGNFQVLELGGDNQIDASGMTNFRFDLYFPNPIVAAEQFLLKLVNINGGVSEELVFINSSSTPAIAQGTWLSFDLPLASLTNLTGTSNIQQVVFDLLSENDVGEVYVDNIYFYKPGGPVPPAAPASAPTQAAGDVISIYSDSYTDNPRVGLALYGAAAFEEVDIAGSGNSALKYTRTDVVNGNFQVLELGGDNQIDASGMTNFRFDLYFPNPIVAAEQFLLKLVNINGGASEELVFINSSSTPAIAQGTWLSFDLALADLTGLAGTSNIQQVVFDLLSENDVGEVYVDNIYFYNSVSGDGTFVNGDFEAGDFTGWTQEPNGGSITLDTSQPGGRTGTVARLVATGSAAGAQDVLLSQVDLTEINGVTISANDSVTVSADVYGSLLGDGGVVFIELISNNSLGEETGRSFIGPAPIFPSDTWTTYPATVNVAADVSGGVTLQLKASCGPIDGCGVDAYFDNVSIVIN